MRNRRTTPSHSVLQTLTTLRSMQLSTVEVSQLGVEITHKE
jgi:hypothetical protein